MGWAALPCCSWIQAKVPISIPTTRPRPKGLAAAIEPPNTPSGLPLLRPLAAFAATTAPPYFLPQKSQRTQKVRDCHPATNHSFRPPLLAPSCGFCGHNSITPFSAAKIAEHAKDLRLTPSHQPLLPASPSCAPLRLLRPQQHHLIFSRKIRRRRKNCGGPPAGNHSLLSPAPFAPPCGFCGHSPSNRETNSREATASSTFGA